MSMFDCAGRLRSIQEQITAAALSVGRNPAEISLLAVSKTQSIEQMRNLAAAGITVFGESRLQEALPKIKAFSDSPGISFHFIGRLQSNKTKAATGKFDLIHSVDRISLAGQLQLHAKSINRMQDVLIQVNLAGEEQKGGVDKEGVEPLYEAITASPNLRMRGFMMVPPWHKDSEKNRKLFASMKKLFDIYAERNEFINVLSMGMSDDYKVAIQEGSTLVRIGTALFGTRN